MSTSPAGWYPQEDGRLRYWDGQKWTEHFAPGQAPSPMGAPAPSGVPGAAPWAPTAGPAVQPDGAKAPRPWFKKKRVLIPAGLLALVILGSALSGEDTETVPASAESSPTASTSAETAAASPTAAAPAKPVATTAAPKAAPKPAASPPRRSARPCVTASSSSPCAA